VVLAGTFKLYGVPDRALEFAAALAHVTDTRA
jgi:hypothetical protein